ncbi:hypothetical protein HanIR_Chr12g0602501 [Helianthus annuus]|nr:hypothetical protein HanIR_Chr12g0602501 [Helianthus annuus]
MVSDGVKLTHLKFPATGSDVSFRKKQREEDGMGFGKVFTHPILFCLLFFSITG